MNDRVRAMLLNPPVSIAPDGAPLMFIPVTSIRKGVGTVDDCRVPVLRAQHTGTQS